MAQAHVLLLSAGRGPCALPTPAKDWRLPGDPGVLRQGQSCARESWSGLLARFALPRCIRGLALLVLHGGRCGSCSAARLPVPAWRPDVAVGEALVAGEHCRWGTWPAPWYLVGSPTKPPPEHLLRISVSECRLRSVIDRISNVARTFWQLC